MTTPSITSRRKTGAMLVECGQCRARGGLVEWDTGRKTWVCPSCETGIWEDAGNSKLAAPEPARPAQTPVGDQLSMFE